MTERMSKTEFVGAIADKTGVTKKDVKAVLDAMNEVVMGELSKGGPGETVIPGLLKLNVVIKPAVPEREGINPFTKQPTVFKAKAERRLVKARVLKGLKDAISGDVPGDDLAIIEGIGPKIAKALNKAGILTFVQLADAGADKIAGILSEAKLPGDPTTWGQQARLAAQGKMDELKQLQDKLQGGRQV